MSREVLPTALSPTTAHLSLRGLRWPSRFHWLGSTGNPGIRGSRPEVNFPPPITPPTSVRPKLPAAWPGRRAAPAPGIPRPAGPRRDRATLCEWAWQLLCKQRVVIMFSGFSSRRVTGCLGTVLARSCLPWRVSRVSLSCYHQTAPAMASDKLKACPGPYVVVLTSHWYWPDSLSGGCTWESVLFAHILIMPSS